MGATIPFPGGPSDTLGYGHAVILHDVCMDFFAENIGAGNVYMFSQRIRTDKDDEDLFYMALTEVNTVKTVAQDKLRQLLKQRTDKLRNAVCTGARFEIIKEGKFTYVATACKGGIIATACYCSFSEDSDLGAWLAMIVPHFGMYTFLEGDMEARLALAAITSSSKSPYTERFEMVAKIIEKRLDIEGSL